MTDAAAPSKRPPHPFFYFVLFLPFGATAGYVAVALALSASKHGMSDGTVTALAAMNTLPHTFKFFWAPITDSTLTRRFWYGSANIVSSTCILLMGIVPTTQDNLPWLQIIVFMNGLATTFVGMSTEALMAHSAPIEMRGRAAGWSQAGNVGGAGIGGYFGLKFAQWLPHAWMASLAVGLILAACQLALIPFDEPPKDTSVPLKTRLAEVGRDLWGVLSARTGVLAIALCFLPIGSGAASNAFSAIAKHWHASDDLVAMTGGWLSSAAAIPGCLFGGFLSDKMNRKVAYALAGLMLAAAALGMAVFPRTPANYGVWVTAYNFATGIVYGTFTGFVLEVIGKGAAATKYNVFASLSNIPIYYMSRVDGWTTDHHGVTWMLLVDAASGVAGIALLVIVILALGLHKPAPTAADAAPADAGPA